MSAYDTLTNLRRKIIAWRLITPSSAPAAVFETYDRCMEVLDDGLRELVMEPIAKPDPQQVVLPFPVSRRVH